MSSRIENEQQHIALATGQGTVVKKSQGTYCVRSAGRVVVCASSSRLRKNLIYPTAAPTSLHHRVQEVKDIGAVDPVAVGDLVAFNHAGDGTGLITSVLPRRNQLARPAAGDRPLEQVIVANVDRVVPVMAAARPAPKWELLDRYLAAAEAAGVPSLIVITKADLEPGAGLAQDLRTFERLGYPIILTSTITGAGLAELRAALTGVVSVFVGKSGVGKTSLLNAVEPGLGLRVRAVSEATGKGRHTTSHPELFDLSQGGAVVDTPGMREFGLWKLRGEDLAQAFVEMRPYLGRCKFGLDCTHTHEPACAIKAAVDAGDIAERRYHSFLRMQDD